MIRLAVAALLLAALGPPAAAQQSPGSDAFARRDFAAAAALWRDEAVAGSAQAKFGLGLMNDLGLGMPRDAAKALRWYLEAAEGGFPDAQFNVAVMLDSGAGVPPDAVAAAVWYARAAANGHLRAQYNLGLLYDAGDGVPRNPDLAGYWLGLAAGALPAATARLAALTPTEPDQRQFVAPDPLAGAIVPVTDGRDAELVWSGLPGPPDARFLIEVARLPTGAETSGTMLLSSLTDASALRFALPDDAGPFAWRASLIDARATRYAASPWQRLPGGGGEGSAGLPRGRITLRVQPGDRAAARFASELTGSFSSAGLWVRVQPEPGAAAISSVHYVYAEDAALAAEIADFLPVLNDGDQAQAAEPDTSPGEILVRLVGGPEDTAGRAP